MSDEFVNVHSAWDGWRAANVRVADLRGVHWHRPSFAPTSILHGYVDCTDVVSGALPHDCDPASRPHRLLVCILRRHTSVPVYLEVAGRAGLDGTEAGEEGALAVVAVERRRAVRGRLPTAGAVGAVAALLVLTTWRARRRRRATGAVRRASFSGTPRAASA
jgi:hypothetical protein